MTTLRLSVDATLQAELEQPHQATLSALGDDGANPLAAITWTCTHLAAVARVLHPQARRVLPDSRDRMKAVAAADHALQDATWWLDRRLTGDARVAAHDVEALKDAVRIALDLHTTLERGLVRALAQYLTPAEQQVLAGRLADAVRRGPTRPHPNTPVRGPLAALGFRLDAEADHLRDLIDSRNWPTPHDHPTARASGRWGAYLTAAPYPPERD